MQKGEADIGIATEALEGADQIVTFPYYEWHHAVIVPKGHSLESKKKLSLAEIANYPIMTYHEGYTGRGQIDKAFADAGLKPDIIMSALDADVIKSYVELGLGVGIVASMAYSESRDHDLKLINTDNLFQINPDFPLGISRGVDWGEFDWFFKAG